MGKIFIDFRISIGALSIGVPAGVDFAKLREIMTSLPGETTLTNIFEVVNAISLYKIYRVEAENDLFPNGTEIQPKYVQRLYTANGVKTFHDTFDGITIIDPPTGVVVLGPGSTGISTMPASAGLGGGGGGAGGPHSGSIGGHAITWPTINWGNGSKDPMKISQDASTIRSNSNSCTCGADKCGGIHSSWCDKND